VNDLISEWLVYMEFIYFMEVSEQGMHWMLERAHIMLSEKLTLRCSFQMCYILDKTVNGYIWQMMYSI